MSYTDEKLKACGIRAYSVTENFDYVYLRRVIKVEDETKIQALRLSFQAQTGAWILESRRINDLDQVTWHVIDIDENQLLELVSRGMSINAGIKIKLGPWLTSLRAKRSTLLHVKTAKNEIRAIKAPGGHLYSFRKGVKRYVERTK